MGNRVNVFKKLVSYITSICMALSVMLLAIPVTQAGTNGMINQVTAAAGNYYEGDTVNVFVYFKEPVNVIGVPYIETNVGNAVYYKAGDGTSTLEFSGIVPKIQNPMPLNYVGMDSLKLDQGSYIKSSATGIDMNLTLPDPQAGNSLIGSSVNLVKPQIECIARTPSGAIYTSNYPNIRIQNTNGMWVDFNNISISSIGNGKYEIYKLADGEYYIWAEPIGKDYGMSPKTTIKIQNGLLAYINGAPAGSNVCELTLTTPQIVGTVMAPGGGALQEMCGVNVIGVPDKYYGTGTSNTGEYNISGLADGDYTIRAMPNNTSSYAASSIQKITIKDGVLAAVNGSPVTPGSACNLELNTSTLTGTIETPASVVLTDANYNVDISSVDSSGKGQFEYSMFLGNSKDFKLGGFEPSKTYIIGARAFNSNNQVLMQGETRITTDQFGSLSSDNIIIKLMEPQIKCIVKTPNGDIFNSNYNYANIRIEKPDGNWIDKDNYPMITSTGDGKYDVYKLADGDYYMWAEASGKDYGASLKTQIKIQNGLLAEVNGVPSTTNIFELSLRKPQIVGTVKTPEGASLQGWCDINITDSTGNKNNFGTNELGEYSLNDLADGDYIIRAIPNSYSSNNYAPSKPKKITIKGGLLVAENGDPITGNICDLQLGVPSFTGTIETPTGTVSTDVYYGVDVFSIDGFGKGYFEYGMFLQNNNSFKLGSFEPDKTYTISVRGFNNNNQVLMQGETKITTNASGDPLVNNTVIKLMEPQIKCIVKTPNNEIFNAVNNYANIRIEKPDDKWVDKENYPMITSTEIGKYDVYKLADSDYYMWAEVSGKDYGASLKTQIRIQNGVVSDVYGTPLVSNVFELKLRKPQVVGTVKTPNGGSLQEWCDINITDSIGNNNGFGTNELGEYNLNDLEDGEYTLRAMPNSYI